MAKDTGKGKSDESKTSSQPHPADTVGKARTTGDTTNTPATPATTPAAAPDAASGPGTPAGAVSKGETGAVSSASRGPVAGGTPGGKASGLTGDAARVPPGDEARGTVTAGTPAIGARVAPASMRGEGTATPVESGSDFGGYRNPQDIPMGQHSPDLSRGGSTHPDMGKGINIGKGTLPTGPGADGGAGGPGFAQGQVRAHGTADGPAFEQGSPMFSVHTSFGGFVEGQQLTLNEILRSGADPLFLQRNGSIKPITAGGIAMMGTVGEHGLTMIDRVSHEQAITAIQEQTRAEYEHQLQKLQAEVEALQRERQYTGATFDRHALELKAAQEEVARHGGDAKKIAEDNQKLRARVKELEEENEELRGMRESNSESTDRGEDYIPPQTPALGDTEEPE